LEVVLKGKKCDVEIVASWVFFCKCWFLKIGQYGAYVDEGQANLVAQVLPSIEEASLSVHSAIVSNTMIGTFSNRNPNLIDEECKAV